MKRVCEHCVDFFWGGGFHGVQGARFSPKDPLLLRRLQSLTRGMGGFTQEMAGPKIESPDSPGDMPMPALSVSEIEQGVSVPYPNVLNMPAAENSMSAAPLLDDYEHLPPAPPPTDPFQMQGQQPPIPEIDPFQMQQHASHVMQEYQVRAQSAAGAKRQRHSDGSATATAEGLKQAVGGNDVTVQLRNNGRLPNMDMGATFEISLQVSSFFCPFFIKSLALQCMSAWCDYA